MYKIEVKDYLYALNQIMNFDHGLNLHMRGIASRSGCTALLKLVAIPVDDFDGGKGSAASASGSDDSDQSNAVPISLSQLQNNYANDPESVVEGTPTKLFEEQEGQSDDSELHTPASDPSVSAVFQSAKRSEILVGDRGQILMELSGNKRDD